MRPSVRRPLPWLVAMVLLGAPWLPAWAQTRGRGSPGALAALVRRDPIPYGADRLDEMAAYSARHYGEATWRLAPRAIVLHYTCGPSFSSAWHTFARNRPHHGELPGVCAHYVVDARGTVHELVSPEIRCRHATGINHVAIGIEFVQRCVRGGARVAEREMLERDAQMRGGLRIVRALQERFHIGRDAILGHAMVNRSPFFLDLLGGTNDHGDWRRSAVSRFVRRLDDESHASTQSRVELDSIE